MEKDVVENLVPFFVSATFGSTSCCSFDNLSEIGPVCKEFGAWLHVDGAYAGNAMICDEFKYLMKGIEYASSFNTNPNKWLLTNFDCSTMWVKDPSKFVEMKEAKPEHIEEEPSDQMPNYRHWGIPLSRRFRSLKLWFVFRSYGLEGLREYIRNHCRLAKKFESYVRADPRFEICNDVKMGLVCFRLKGPNKINQELSSSINGSGKLHMKPTYIREKLVLRFCVVAEKASKEDMKYAWDVISSIATEILVSHSMKIEKDGILNHNSKSDGVERNDGDEQLFRRLSQQYSFTKTVTREAYERTMSKASLHDGVSPIILLDDGEEEATKDDVLFHCTEMATDELFVQ
ncbi:hypothetical protein J437_LFUL001428 [Ladona fulva]|uniref:Tyrosine decarboxylase n=1 Tax=Ladona fulva TaxID=123851 RepID=A0A8K0NRP9_LADFU|nr:hypothetical protein J437_LFUL001428 [Ladona fulva]